MSRQHIYILIALVVIVLAVTARYSKRKNYNLKEEHWLGNIWIGLKPYLVAIEFYDGKPNDTIIAWYGYPPGNRDINVWGTEGAYGSHAVPSFWSSNVLSDTTKIYYGVRNVSILMGPEQWGKPPATVAKTVTPEKLK